MARPTNRLALAGDHPLRQWLAAVGHFFPPLLFREDAIEGVCSVAPPDPKQKRHQNRTKEEACLEQRSYLTLSVAWQAEGKNLRVPFSIAAVGPDGPRDAAPMDQGDSPMLASASVVCVALHPPHAGIDGVGLGRSKDNVGARRLWHGDERLDVERLCRGSSGKDLLGEAGGKSGPCPGHDIHHVDLPTGAAQTGHPGPVWRRLRPVGAAAPFSWRP